MSCGLCSCGACPGACWNGGDGPDGWCTDCRNGRHSRDREEERQQRHAGLSGAHDDQAEEES
jgi:hypothetical protein